jgi:hypothetical protein
MIEQLTQQLLTSQSRKISNVTIDTVQKDSLQQRFIIYNAEDSDISMCVQCKYGSKEREKYLERY